MTILNKDFMIPPTITKVQLYMCTSLTLILRLWRFFALAVTYYNTMVYLLLETHVKLDIRYFSGIMSLLPHWIGEMTQAEGKIEGRQFVLPAGLEGRNWAGTEASAAAAH